MQARHPLGIATLALVFGCERALGDAPAEAVRGARDADADIGGRELRPGTGERDAGADAGSLEEPVVTTRVITQAHRAVPGKMFGGWGPHLGHLVRRPGGELWFVDDACDAAPAQGTPCDVDRNGRLDAFRLGPGGWERRAQLTLPAGVQQNTGTIATEGALESYGIDVVASRVVGCRLSPETPGSWACSNLPLLFPASTNYVGAAISPDGWKVVWATTVVDGGGGAFHWMVDYGGGWNGPRTGRLEGFNDASYVNVAFGGGAKKNQLVAFAQLVSGRAPAWTFRGAVAEGDAASNQPLAFSVLPPSGADPIASTNDVVIDPVTNDAHLVARSEGGAAVFYSRPAGGAWSGAVGAIPETYRARFVQLADGRLVLVYGKNGQGLWMRVAQAGRQSGVPVAWSAIPERRLALPPGYDAILAIYTESAATQRERPEALDVAVVGATRESEALHVHVQL
jgi:hypothetical protein